LPPRQGEPSLASHHAMSSIIERVKTSPVFIRVIPFGLFLLLTFAQSWVGEDGRYWLYLVKTIIGAWMLWLMRPFVDEMRWKISVEAVVTGIVVFIVWIGVDDFLAMIGLKPDFGELKIGGKPWNPQHQFGAGSLLAWFFIVVRIVGSTLIVPPLEEVFYRSFLYRYLVNPDFLLVPLGVFATMPFFVTSAVFGFEHREWLAGIICGLAYAGLVCWKKRLGDAITAHAITNLLLGIWVVAKGEWKFW
jgi:CAAX prenyl protease-like protein